MIDTNKSFYDTGHFDIRLWKIKNLSYEFSNQILNIKLMTEMMIFVLP